MDGEDIFKRLQQAGVKRLIDVRLNNISQLSGFAKARDLDHFLKTISGIEYEHFLILAPTDDILKAYKKGKTSWAQYEHEFLDIMQDREIEKKLSPDQFDHGCLLCSEDKPHHCHRRLVCDYLNEKWGERLDVKHL